MQNPTLSAIEGIRVGHAHNLDGLTGCTVILAPPNTVGGIDQRGGAPATRETDLLRPMHHIQHVHAILLTGGSAYGLDAATGVMQYLEEQQVGFDVRVGVVPIVPAAVIFDLDVGRSNIRPNSAMGYAACEAATTASVTEGCVGAGAGARVGALAGIQNACKSGIGTAAVELGGGVTVAALMVVNAAGDVVDGKGRIIAGARSETGYINMMEYLKANPVLSPPPISNTVIGVVVTNALLTKEQANKVAQMAHNGMAQAVRPAHTLYDGDTIFALATGKVTNVNVSAIGAWAAEMTALAIRRAIYQATSLGGLPTGTQYED
ncbi:MAG: P1 family peptidase [Anaerolineales bacterium]|nr:P1 family peptidase [Anaerolineales bacterium]